MNKTIRIISGVNTLRLLFVLSCVVCVWSVSCSPPARSLRYNGSMEGDRGMIVRTAKRYIGVRYRSGGTTPSGFDCSGYVMYVYKKNRIAVPRTVREQYRHGNPVSLRMARPGDLVFFHTTRRRYSHVGIYLGGYRFIHAPRTGRRVSCADIRNSYWKKRYIGAVSYISDRKKGRNWVL